MASIPVSPGRRAELEALAREQGQTLGEIAEEVVALGLARRADLRERTRAVRAELDRRWENYQDGLTVPLDGDAVFERLRAKSAGRRAERP